MAATVADGTLMRATEVEFAALRAEWPLSDVWRKVMVDYWRKERLAFRIAARFEAESNS